VYCIFPTVLSVYNSHGWWIDADVNTHVCSDVSMLSSYQVARISSVLMGNGVHASFHGIGTINLRFTSGKTV
jgi:hypothetical protein